MSAEETQELINTIREESKSLLSDLTAAIINRRRSLAVKDLGDAKDQADVAVVIEAMDMTIAVIKKSIDEAKVDIQNLELALSLVVPPPEPTTKPSRAAKNNKLPALSELKIFTQGHDIDAFLMHNATILKICGTDPEFWYRVLGKTTQDTVLTWVDTHILSLDPTPSWEDAASIFRKEFSSYDHAAQCMLKLVQMKQSDVPNRTASDFLREVEVVATAAGTKLDDPLLICLLISVALSKNVSRIIQERLGSKITTITFADLKTEVVFTGHVREAKDNSDDSKGKGGKPMNCKHCNKPGHNWESCRVRQSKKCTHCLSFGHVIAECNKLKQGLPANRSSPASSSTTTTVPPTALICYKCNQNGHKADNPICPRFSQRSTFNPSSIAKKIMAIREEKEAYSDSIDLETEFQFTEQQIAEALYDYEISKAGGK